MLTITQHSFSLNLWSGGTKKFQSPLGGGLGKNSVYKSQHCLHKTTIYQFFCILSMSLSLWHILSSNVVKIDVKLFIFFLIFRGKFQLGKTSSGLIKRNECQMGGFVDFLLDTPVPPVKNPCSAQYSLASSTCIIFTCRGDPGGLSHKESWSTPIIFKTSHLFVLFFLH